MDLAPYLDDTTLDEAAVDAFVANNGYLTVEVDGDASNEIQDLSLTTNTLGLSGSAATVDLAPYLDDTTLDEAAVDAFVANNGYLTVEVDGDASNEIQDLSLTTNTLGLSGSAATVDLAPYLDNTDAQDLSVAQNTLRH